MLFKFVSSDIENFTAIILVASLRATKVADYISSSTSQMVTVWKDEAKICQRWSLPECFKF